MWRSGTSTAQRPSSASASASGWRCSVPAAALVLVLAGSAAAQERLVYQDSNVEAVVERAGTGVGDRPILDVTLTNKTAKPLSRATVTLRFYDAKNRLLREAAIPLIALDSPVAKVKYTAPVHARLELGPVRYEFTP